MEEPSAHRVPDNPESLPLMFVGNELHSKYLPEDIYFRVIERDSKDTLEGAKRLAAWTYPNN
jgi:hypothetical protein